MPPLFVALKIATGSAVLFVGAAETVAVFSVLEIGPNLLALGTSIIGAVVLLVQLRVAGHIRETKDTVKDSHRQLTEALSRDEGPRGAPGDRGPRGPEGPDGPRGPGGHSG